MNFFKKIEEIGCSGVKRKAVFCEGILAYAKKISKQVVQLLLDKAG